MWWAGLMRGAVTIALSYNQVSFKILWQFFNIMQMPDSWIDVTWYIIAVFKHWGYIITRFSSNDHVYHNCCSVQHSGMLLEISCTLLLVMHQKSDIYFCLTGIWFHNEAIDRSSSAATCKDIELWRTWCGKSRRLENFVPGKRWKHWSRQQPTSRPQGQRLKAAYKLSNNNSSLLLEKIWWQIHETSVWWTWVCAVCAQ